MTLGAGERRYAVAGGVVGAVRVANVAGDDQVELDGVEALGGALLTIISKVGDRFDRAALATVRDHEKGRPGRGDEVSPVRANGERKRVRPRGHEQPGRRRWHPFGIFRQHADATHAARLLRARHKRPKGATAAEKGYDFPPPHGLFPQVEWALGPPKIRSALNEIP